MEVTEPMNAMDQALEVPSEDDCEVDVECAPTSGLEYLKRVRQEAQKCAHVVVADINIDHFTSRQTVRVSAASGVQEAPSGLAPSLEWQRYQTALFSDLRQKLTRLQAMYKDKEKTKTTLPSLYSEEEWCKFCFGSDFNSTRYKRRTDNTAMKRRDSLDEVIVGTPPLLSIITSLDQSTVCQLLEYHTKWLNIMGFTTEQGRWLYALLACLEKPVLADIIAWLRTLARHCSSVRSTIEEENDSRLTQLNLLVCIVARYFDQSDMTDTPSSEL
ncbi:gem-associated protein 2-like [Glandiceps talaboti]